MSRGCLLAVMLSVVALLPALLSTPALAQEPAGAADKNYAQMFLFSGDAIGLMIVWLLVIASLVNIAYMIKLSIQYRRSSLMPEHTRSEIEALIAEKRYRAAIEYASSDPSYLGRVTSSALNEAANGYGAMERAIEEAGDIETTRYMRPLEYLNVVGNIAPMIGLFGTVYGMIVAFQQLVDAGGNPDPTNLAAGISTALVTTFWGLVVAIPALAAYALIRNKIDALTSEGMVLAEDLISPFKPSRQAVDHADSETGDGPQARPSATPSPEGEAGMA